ncbi:MAG TPA: hypothetical protein VLL52_13540 [Anaerolineae bacterium]|nr:hypothetical protein [Anaerolineae bacterium]
MKQNIVGYLHVIVALCAIFLALFLITFSGTYQTLGNIISFVPEKLNMLRQVSSADLTTITFDADIPASLTLTDSQYYLYSDSNLDRLTITGAQTSDQPDLEIYNRTPNSFGGRRYAGQDFPQLAALPARPTAFLDVHNNDTYQFTNDNPVSLTVAPNYTNYNDLIIIIMTFVQIAIIYGLYYATYRWYHRDKLMAVAQKQSDRRDAMSDFLKNLDE